MQVYPDKPQLWQQQLVSLYGRGLELGKQQGLELPVFFKAWKAMPQFLKSLPASMQLLNCLLQYLTWYERKTWKFLFCAWQRTVHNCFIRKFLVCRHDVLVMDRTPINQALTAIAPIFIALCRCFVLNPSLGTKRNQSILT